MFQQALMKADPTLDAFAPLAFEPFPFHQTNDLLVDDAHDNSDPFFQSMLQLLVSADDSESEPVTTLAAWPQLKTITIPTANALHITTDLVTTPDDHRTQPSVHTLAMSPGGGTASRKRLHVETLNDKGFGALVDDDEEAQFQKRLLTNSRRDAVATLREEARALETTLKGLHLRQSRSKTDLVSDDPEALVKSYAENIQLKRAIEEQDARIKTLRRAVSMREAKSSTELTNTL